jgi:predicted peptidase
MKNLFSILLLAFCTSVLAQGSFEKHQFDSSNGDKIGYQLLKPVDMKQGKKYPLVLFMHGAGERGSDNQAQMTHGSRMFTNPVNLQKYPCFVLFPQCQSDKYWTFDQRPEKLSEEIFTATPDLSSSIAMVKELVDWYVANLPVDTKRIYVIGLSMGGMATFDLACRYPDMFAAAVPICGGINTSRLTSAAGKVSFRIFHGDADKVVPVELSRNAYTTLKKLDADVEYVEFPGAGHDSWTPAFNRIDFMEWIFKQKK